MVKKVAEYVKRNHMLEKADTVVAGVSGGADSVCLFLILNALKEEMGFRLAAVHLNHKIRPEADEDARYVKMLCQAYDCPYYYFEKKVEEVASEKHISTEEAGRLCRYEAFEEALLKEGIPKGDSRGKIAVAHNQNDNAETVLFHLFRGSGLSGIVGIRPVRGKVIRPLLCVTREEIEIFLQERNVKYCIDKTNEEDTYTRNKIRHHIVAYAEKEICGQAVGHICETARMAEEAESYIRKEAEKAFERCVSEEKTGLKICTDKFCREDALIQKQVLFFALEQMAGSRKDIASVNIKDFLSLFSEEKNREIHLPYELTAYREYANVILRKEKERENRCTECIVQTDKIDFQAGKCTFGDFVFQYEVFPYEKSQKIPEKTYTKWFDYDKIMKALMIRNRKSGDYLVINDKGNKKSLKEYMINEKIGKKERDKVCILAEGSHVLWVVGYRISEYYKVNDKTKTVLQIRAVGGTLDG